jgi:hypothetical protein
MLVIQCKVKCDGRKMISPPHLILVNNKIKGKKEMWQCGAFSCKPTHGASVWRHWDPRWRKFNEYGWNERASGYSIVVAMHRNNRNSVLDEGRLRDWNTARFYWISCVRLDISTCVLMICNDISQVFATIPYQMIMFLKHWMSSMGLLPSITIGQHLLPSNFQLCYGIGKVELHYGMTAWRNCIYV